MAEVRSSNDEQRKAWNGASGHAWSEEQELLDRILAPMGDRIVEGIRERQKRGPVAYDVLDVGCGTGATTLALARLVGQVAPDPCAGMPSPMHATSCVGIDISAPMLEIARTRAAQEGSSAGFLLADAQTHPFESKRFDLVVSRFGVMFFDDPIAAFANLRRAAKDDAELRFVAWRSPNDNPFMTTAERAAAAHLPNMPSRSTDGPGQFAFADEGKVRDILERSGWSEIDIVAVDDPCSFPETELTRYVTRLGPLGRILPEIDEPARARIVEAVRVAFTPFVHGREVRFTAASWLVRAHAGRR